jgi:hypothetical protein
MLAPRHMHEKIKPHVRAQEDYRRRNGAIAARARDRNAFLVTRVRRWIADDLRLTTI